MDAGMGEELLGLTSGTEGRFFEALLEDEDEEFERGIFLASTEEGRTPAREPKEAPTATIAAAQILPPGVSHHLLNQAHVARSSSFLST